MFSSILQLSPNDTSKRKEAIRFKPSSSLEVKNQLGPGYRVYYGREGETVVVLLGGGSKRTQSTAIKKAVRYWLDYQQRRKT